MAKRRAKAKVLKELRATQPPPRPAQFIVVFWDVLSFGGDWSTSSLKSNKAACLEMVRLHKLQHYAIIEIPAEEATKQ